MTKRRLLPFLLSLVCALPVAAQGIQVGGKVTDENGDPFPGVAVTVGDARIGSLTDTEGHYTLTVPSAESVLSFECLGYAKTQVKVGTKRTIDVTLRPDQTVLDEVVVIGYGETRKSDLTGAVAHVKMTDIADTPVSSVDQALQGRVAGADVMTTSGDPTATTSIRIRGTRSITASNEPLIVVDGVIDAVKDLGDINPADIEAISVLKDASSTAIYGAQGANGVIIVTTRQGSPQVTKPWVTLNLKAGVSCLARRLDTMDATEFALFRNEMADYNANYALGTRYSFSDPLSYGTGTDWVDAITRVAPYQQYDLSMGARTKATNWYASFGYGDIQGIIKDSGNRRVTARFAIAHQIAPWLKITYAPNFLYRKDLYNKAAIGGTNYWTGATYLNPLLRADSVVNDLYETGARFNNPTVTLSLNEDFQDSFAATNPVTVEFTPLKGLTVKSVNTYYYWQGHRYRFYPGTLPTKNDGDGGSAYRVEHDTHQFTSDNTVTWKKDVSGGHHFDLMGGYALYWKYINELGISAAKGLLSDHVKWNRLQAINEKENYTLNTWNSRVARNSFLARVNYNYKKKYYLTLTGRFDGSSNFARNNKWGFFPSAALKWNLAKEPFLIHSRGVDELSLRLSAGRTGNDAISAYRSLSSIEPSTNGYLFDGQQSTYYYPARLDSPDLTWEKTDLYNLGLDASFLKGRVKVTAEGYLPYTRDLLLSVQKANQTGYESFYENIGRTSNKGVELTLETKNIVRKKFAWTSSFTISHNRQRVEDIGSENFVVAMSSPGNIGQMMYGYVKGYPLNSLWGYQYGGVWHSAEEIERNKVTHTYAVPSTTIRLGTPRYVDRNGDGVLDTNDLVNLGDADPTFYGGLQNTFNVLGFTIGAYFTYSYGGSIYNYSEFYMAGSYMTNQYRYMKDAWHPVRNPESDLPAAGSIQVHVPSSLQVHDASYLRLKTLSVSYTFDLRATKVFRDLTLGVTGDNLYLWSYYNGFDPDVSTSSSGSTLRRVDMGAYPRARTLIFNLKLRY